MPNVTNSPPATDSSDADQSVESPGILGALIDAYREEGYERGYQRAVQDVLDSLVGITERFIREAGTDAGVSRQGVYAYVEFLEREIQAASRDVAGYVSGGLGI